MLGYLVRVWRCSYVFISPTCIKMLNALVAGRQHAMFSLWPIICLRSIITLQATCLRSIHLSLFYTLVKHSTEDLYATKVSYNYSIWLELLMCFSQQALGLARSLEFFLSRSCNCIFFSGYLTIKLSSNL